MPVSPGRELLMKKKQKDTKLIKGFIITGVIFALVVGCAAFFVMGDGAAKLRSVFRMSGGAWPEAYYYENAADGRFCLVDDSFAVLTGSGLRVYDKKGDESLYIMKPFSRPELSSGGDNAAAWDQGGYDLIFFNEKQQILKLETEERIIAASVNDKGWLSVCTERTGYGGQVTVYNADGAAVYRWSPGSAYLLGAWVRDNKELMALTLGENGSELTLMELTSEKPTAKFTYDGLLIDAAFTETGAAALSDTELILLDKGLGETGTYGFSDRYLNAYKLGSTSVIVTGDYQVGGTRQAALIGSTGETLATCSVAEDVDSLSTVGERTVLLTGGKVLVYGEKLELLGEHEAAGAARVLIHENMTVIVAGDFSAEVLPAFDESRG